MTTISARLAQEGHTMALALAAFSLPRQAPTFADRGMPDVAALDDVARRPYVEGTMPALVQQLDFRPVLGAEPFSAGAEAFTGGWLRLADPRPLDPVLLAAFCDFWVPAVFCSIHGEGLGGVPTVDLTIHFRSPIAHPNDGSVFVQFESRTAVEGFIEEDGCVWAPDGRLLAQSRQLAVLV